MQLNRTISFTASWLHTVWIALILSLMVSFILIFLQPFDTQMHLKNLKLAGYGLCVLIPILVLHVPERWWYYRQGQRWLLFHEILTVTVGIFLLSLLAYLYHSLVVNDTPIRWKFAWQWSIGFVFPFIPVLVPLWIYLRYRFSQITLEAQEPDDETLIAVEGQNTDEQLQFVWSDFILARAQSNYVDLFLLNPEGELEKHVLRSTLSSMVDQLPRARQIHRSYLVNTDHILQLKGNTRQGSADLAHFPDPVPVSPKHFAALREYLQLQLQHRP